jgi:hypothetical protein
VGSVERRIETLEARYGVGVGQFAPHRGEERELVTREAVQRLTSVELAVLSDLMSLREEHPDISGAKFFGLMTNVHHAMESEWLKIVRGVLGDRIEESDETGERKEELQKRVDEALRQGEIPELGLLWG